MSLNGHEQERLLIERRTALLRPDNLDLDTLDERARAVLNLVEADERVILDWNRINGYFVRKKLTFPQDQWAEYK